MNAGPAGSEALSWVRLHESVPGRLPLDAERIWSIPRVGAPMPSTRRPECYASISSRVPGTEHMASRIWRLPFDRDAPHVALTSELRHARRPVPSPDGNQLAFLARPADDTKAPAQVHVLPLDGGEARALGDLPLGALDVQWYPDGASLLVATHVFRDAPTLEAAGTRYAELQAKPRRVHATEERFYRFWDRWLTDDKIARLLRMDVATGDTTDLTPDMALWFNWMDPSGHFDLRPDGNELVFQGSHRGGVAGRLRADVYALDLKTADAQPRCLTEDETLGGMRPRYLPDGETIVYGIRMDPDFYADRVRLVRRHVQTGERTTWMSDWDGSPAAWEVLASGDLVFQADDDGAARVFRLPSQADTPMRLTQNVHVAGPRPTCDGRLTVTVQTLQQPPEVYLLEPQTAALQRLSYATTDALADVHRYAVDDVRFTGAAGDSVQMYVLRDDQAGDAPQPLVHMIHGGPHGAFGNQWHARWNAQAFAARGYTVALVNFHGSTGFGQDYASCIRGAWGDFPSQDIHAATDLLVAKGWADPERIGISGGSYGGYLVSWLASTSDRFTCAVNHAGVYDLALQYASDFTWGRDTNHGGDLWSAPEAVDRYNPARHSKGLNTPMLVIHGAKDYRVPINQALVCYGLLKARGVPARLLYYDDENHWILKPSNSIRWYAEVLDWFDRFLKARDVGDEEAGS